MREFCRQRVRAGVAGDERPRVDLRHVPEPLLVEVAEIDEDPELATARDQPPARVGQATARVGARRGAERNALGEPVRPAPDGTERPQPRLVPERERLELGVDRLRPLDVQDGRGRQRGIVVDGIQVRHGAGDRDLAGELERGQPARGTGRDAGGPAVIKRIGQRLAPQPVRIGLGVVAGKIAVGSIGEHREDRRPGRRPPASAGDRGGRPTCRRRAARDRRP